MERKNYRECLALIVMALVGFTAMAVSAAPISQFTLQDLINTGSTGITVGDKQFYDFTYAPSGTIPPSLSGNNVNPAPPLASQITVSSLTSPNIGLQFAFGWNSSDGYIMDSLIGYKVHVLNGTPQQLIDQVHLDFNGAVSAPGTGTHASVVETIRTLSGAPLGQISVYSDGVTTKLHDTAFLSPPLRDIQVTKDIMVSSTPRSIGGTTSTISFVDNTYHQTEVPEPVSIAFMALSAACILRRRQP